MICQACGKQIGPLRRIVDRQFCCAAHRRQSEVSLDRSLADIDDLTDEPWPLAARARRSRSTSTSAQTASALVLVILGIGVLAALSFSGSGGASRPLAISPSTIPASTGNWFHSVGESIGRIIGSRTPATLTDDFHSGITGWIAARARSAEGARDAFSGSGWSMTADGLKPGRLRIWSRSTQLADYQLDFVGEINRKSLDWAYRALDAGNFYGTKLTILRSGPGPNAGLIRFVKLNGREMDRVELPVPLSLATNEPYRVRVSVVGDRFVTSVNGQVISSWSDQRLQHGGVGFFSDEGESATLKWVSVSDRDSLLGRVVAYFSLIRMPLLEAGNWGVSGN
jgi:hypothetical protein